MKIFLSSPKKTTIILIFLLLCVFIFINLGKFVDVTVKPVQSDIIVSLGGDERGSRIQTALSLYKNGFSKSEKILYTSQDAITNKEISPTLSKKTYLLNKGVQNKNIIHINETIVKNTMEEVFFIKKYMLTHNYKSVIFITHPQHSRRISSLAKYIADYDKYGLKFTIVSCNPYWWDKALYFANKTSFKVTILETIKLFYNLLKYGTPLIHYTNYAKKINNKEWDKTLYELP